MVIQLRDEIRGLVARSELRPGERIPSETELTTQFGVARNTVREALKLLEQDGLVDVQHGRGRFVSPVAALGGNRPITRFESVTELLVGLGFTPTTHTLSAKVGPASQQEASTLGIAEQAPVVRLERLRMSGDLALVLSVNAFRPDLLRGEPLEEQDFSGSLHQWLAARHAAPVSSAAQISAVACPDALRDRPELEQVPAWLLTAERCIGEDGSAVLYSRDYHRGDIFSFHVVRRPD
jgi:GntR family transcriptional regulator